MFGVSPSTGTFTTWRAAETHRLFRVADNLTFHDLTESQSVLIGRDFGIVTDIETGPIGNPFVVSLSGGRIYEIFRR